MMLQEWQLSSQSCVVSHMIHGTFTDLSIVKSVVMTTEVLINVCSSHANYSLCVFNTQRTSEVEKQPEELKVTYK